MLSEETFVDVKSQAYGITDLIQTVSSKLNKRTASEFEDSELHQAGLEATSKIKGIALEIKKKRVEAGLKNLTNEQSSSVIMSTLSLFSQVKVINRRIQQQNIEKKEAIKAHRAEVNSKYLYLKAREAELQILKDQAAISEKKREIVPDIGLLPEEEFDLKAPKEYLSHTNSHEKTINRLKFELHDRKKLLGKLQELAKSKVRINLQNSSFKKEISNVKKATIALNFACSPLNNAINRITSSK